MYSLFSKDQDKTRPLSTLANLAIIITDVQDMDPIFINLPYSTNVYEHSPLVRPSPGPCETSLCTSGRDGGPVWWDGLLGVSYSPKPLCMAVMGVPAQ